MPGQQLLGEYECKLDAKGRMRVPSSLLDQLEGHETQQFVINRGFEKCLTLYPKDVWKRIADEVNQLNTYKKINRTFLRYF
ncbi:MAG: MraZ N-terminal domain-containing protein, partial [Saprospiraceae bacterium]|nr:MraZ N-terminal domain-containing protein [Saprospiraceae bacterium]